MSKTRPTLTPDERPEWDSLIRDAVNGDYSRTDVTAKTAKVMELVEDAEKQGHGWAARALEEAAFNGMREFLKAWLRENDVAAYKGHDGQVSSMSLRAGVKRGEGHQQVLFAEMTKRELEAHVRMLLKQRSGLNDRITAERRLLKLMEGMADDVTVGEALASEGVSLDDVLGKAA